MVIEVSVESSLKAVEDLFEYRDLFFKNNGFEQADKKGGLVQERLDRVLRDHLRPILGEYKDEPLDKIPGKLQDSKILYAFGKALSIGGAYSKVGHDCLAKAVKLEPENAHAWYELGESFYLKGDLNGALNCFTGALEQDANNKEALRCLSAALRIKAARSRNNAATFAEYYPEANESERERICLDLVKESLDKAKDAVKVDLDDGVSWYFLGNAHLALFFASDKLSGEKASEITAHLTSALKAYIRAEKDPIAAANPDLYYNRGCIYEYLENFMDALGNFAYVTLLEPENEEAKQKTQGILDFTATVCDFLSKGGAVKAKKLNALSSSIPEYVEGMSICYHDQDNLKRDYEMVSLSGLNDGLNNGKAIPLCVVNDISKSEQVHKTFIMVDQNKDLVVMTVYNVADDAIKINDHVVVPNAKVSLVAIDLPKDNNEPKAKEDISLKYPSIRVENPITLLVNKVKLDKSSFIRARASS
eukprot:Nk52_evm31s293 gene=Nk52_evmTU31s293